MRNLYGFISRDERLRIHRYHGQRDSERKSLIRTLQLESKERQERGDGGEGVPECIEGAHDLEIRAAETNNDVYCYFVLKSMASLTRPQMSLVFGFIGIAKI